MTSSGAGLDRRQLRGPAADAVAGPARERARDLIERARRCDVADDDQDRAGRADEVGVQLEQLLGRRRLHVGRLRQVVRVRVIAVHPARQRLAGDDPGPRAGDREPLDQAAPFGRHLVVGVGAPWSGPRR